VGGWPRLTITTYSVQVQSKAPRRYLNYYAFKVPSPVLPTLRPSTFYPPFPVVNAKVIPSSQYGPTTYATKGTQYRVWRSGRHGMERQICSTGKRHDQNGNRPIFDHIRRRPRAAYTLTRVQPESPDPNYLQSLQCHSRLQARIPGT
jgi:hypothetical protein